MELPPAEYQRQLRNLFSVLRVIVRRTAEGQAGLETYAAHLEGRIGALARVHQMLMRAPGAEVDLNELVCGEIRALVMPARRYSIDGPEIRIAGDAAGPLALALHELAVNALIHGAFGTPEGHVAVEWKIVSEGGAEWLQLDWRETGVTIPVRKSVSRGFGVELIERTLPYELNARTSIAFDAGGAHYHIQVPQGATSPLWRGSPES
jgi:two-component system, chemotaxis family, CheB/CheR fusion protein